MTVAELMEALSKMHPDAVAYCYDCYGNLEPVLKPIGGESATDSVFFDS